MDAKRGGRLPARGKDLIDARKRSEARLHDGVERLVAARGLVDEQTVVWTESVLARMPGSIATKRRILDAVTSGGAFDVKSLARHSKTGKKFDLDSCLVVPEMGGEIGELLAEWRPRIRGNVAVGAHEAYLLLTIAGATITTKGDLQIPGLGCVEIKSVASTSSHACLTEGVDETEARIKARRLLIDAGFDFSSLARRNLAEMRDVMEPVPFCDLMIALFSTLTLGEHKMTRSVARAIWSDPTLEDAGFYGPLAGMSFDRCKARRGFDMALFVNRETRQAAFAKTGSSLLASVASGHLRVAPSGLGFKSERATSVGITL
jgi:hypothetical protein